MARILLGLLAISTSRLSTAGPSSGLLRGGSRPSVASKVSSAAVAEESANVTAQWGVWWGSCYDYGCFQPYRIGHLCGCWPGCEVLGLCCSDYYQACFAPVPTLEPTTTPTPVPDPVHPPAPAPSPLHPPAPALPGSSDAPVYTFYVYRAQSDASYPPKSVNAANLIGAMWYLQHEVVTQSPPKFGITRILRYKVQTKAPARLLAAGMDFGVRYTYDGQKCTGPGDCSTMYAKYGFFVGCNNFASNYPYPKGLTHYDGGVWYSLPREGACSLPTGAADCTYSYSWPPEEISLDELIGGESSAFWAHADDDLANARKVQAAADTFKLKYPDSALLTEPQCNFDFQKFWQ